MSESEKRAKAIEKEFKACSDWEARYEKLIQLGKNLPRLPEELKTEDNKVKGCQSQVWLSVTLDETGKMRLQADSDALIAKGLVALVLSFFNDLSPEEALKADISFISSIGLTSHLSPSRTNGLNSMIKKLRYYALAFCHQTGKPIT